MEYGDVEDSQALPSSNLASNNSLKSSKVNVNQAWIRLREYKEVRRTAFFWQFTMKVFNNNLIRHLLAQALQV